MSIYILLVGLRADRPRLAGSSLSVFERVSHRRCLIVAASPVPFRCHPSPNCFLTQGRGHWAAASRFIIPAIPPLPILAIPLVVASWWTS